MSSKEEHLTEAKRITQLRKYINLIGLDWSKITQERIDDIARTEAYKQFKKLDSIKRTIKRNQEMKEDIDRKRQVVALIGKGFSHETKIPKSLSGAPKARGFKMPKSDAIRFSKSHLGHVPQSARVRLPRIKKMKTITPKKVAIFSSLDIDIKNYISEENHNKVDKILQKSKQLKDKDTFHKSPDPADFEIKKTMTGNSANTNVVEINPAATFSSRTQNFQ